MFVLSVVRNILANRKWKRFKIWPGLWNQRWKKSGPQGETEVAAPHSCQGLLARSKPIGVNSLCNTPSIDKAILGKRMRRDNTYDLFIPAITFVKPNERLEDAEERMDRFVREMMGTLLWFFPEEQTRKPVRRWKIEGSG